MGFIFEDVHKTRSIFSKNISFTEPSIAFRASANNLAEPIVAVYDKGALYAVISRVYKRGFRGGFNISYTAAASSAEVYEAINKKNVTYLMPLENEWVYQIIDGVDVLNNKAVSSFKPASRYVYQMSFSRCSVLDIMCLRYNLPVFTLCNLTSRQKNHQELDYFGQGAMVIPNVAGPCDKERIDSIINLTKGKNPPIYESMITRPYSFSAYNPLNVAVYSNLDIIFKYVLNDTYPFLIYYNPSQLFSKERGIEYTRKISKNENEFYANLNEWINFTVNGFLSIQDMVALMPHIEAYNSRVLAKYCSQM